MRVSATPLQLRRFVPHFRNLYKYTFRPLLQLNSHKQRPRHPSKALLRNHGMKKYLSTTPHLRWSLRYKKFEFGRQGSDSQISLHGCRFRYLLFICGQTPGISNLTHQTLRLCSSLSPFLTWGLLLMSPPK